eukprot:CAMPEP_0175181024 /NCGR_PEP_ID=MMETSP0087-20121206/36416_1 /TAXON_ID=136419 /ORGANISM="Unknown Unknown, Strain D1" /LENGTH=218 /DNA_ID=CAMNT_0016473475 /DNA_START=345 /DNA_END=1002 /DNA_ORIENTATION=-
MEEVVTLVEEVHMQVRGVVHTQLLPAPLPGSEFQPLWCFGIHARLHLSPIADNSMDRGIIVCAWADTLPFQHRAGADGVVHMAPQREVDFIVEQQRLQVPSSAEKELDGPLDPVEEDVYMGLCPLTTTQGVRERSTPAKSALRNAYCSEPCPHGSSVSIATMCTDPTSTEYHPASCLREGTGMANLCCVATPHSPPLSSPPIVPVLGQSRSWLPCMVM